MPNSTIKLSFIAKTVTSCKGSWHRGRKLGGNWGGGGRGQGTGAGGRDRDGAGAGGRGRDPEQGQEVDLCCLAEIWS